METKTKVRKEKKVLRQQMTEVEVQSKSNHICKELLAASFYQESKVLLLYASIRKEVDLSLLFADAIASGKQVFFPKVDGDTMEFFLVKGMEDFSLGAFSIMEPKGNTISFAAFLKSTGANTEKIPVLVPGLAFSPDGNRIGYGKGYYDSFFHRMEEEHIPVLPIGVCYENQIVTDVAFEEQDYRMNYIFTENREVICDDGIGSTL